MEGFISLKGGLKMIFYFTGTGNSKYAAETIAEYIKEQVNPLDKALKVSQGRIDISSEDYLGFIFPVYYFGVPSIVEEFIRRIKLDGTPRKGSFLVLTCGGTTGNAHGIFKDMLEERDIKLDYIFAVDMPDNYILLYNLQKPQQQKNQLDNADNKLRKIADSILSEDKGNHNDITGPFHSLITWIAYPFYRRGRKTKSFHATEACDGCGLCEKACPSDTITMHSRQPEWMEEKCIHCLACIHRCPQKAIQYGKKTGGRGRYVNPNTSLDF